MPTITLTDQERDLILIALADLRITSDTVAPLRSIGLTTVQGFDHARFAIEERLAQPAADEARQP
jgi:hypothetical protein